MNLTAALRKEYRDLFDTCEIRENRLNEADRLARKISAQRARYFSVSNPLGIPWYFTGITHMLEASQKFDRHLHNGDPLNARTVQVPAGRPKSGDPPFTWEQSAADALQYERLHQVTDWTLTGTLYRLEKYNGFGYRSKGIYSPYLWSFSNHYTKGKYVADGSYSATAVSQQCGAAVLFRRLAELGEIRFDAQGEPMPAADPETLADVDRIAPLVPYAPRTYNAHAEALQRALNLLPGIFLRVDGKAGEKTSNAFRKVTGHYLSGDPRA